MKTDSKRRRSREVIPLSELPDLVQTLRKTYVKFFLQYNKKLIPAVIFPDEDGFVLLLTKNPVEWFYEQYEHVYDVHDDNMTDSCLVMVVEPKKTSYINNLSNSSCGPDITHGWQVMELVHAVNTVFDVQSSNLEDRSRRSGEMPLKIWSVIRTGKTWYEYQDFKLKNESERESFLNIKTSDIASKFVDSYPKIVEKLLESGEPLFYKAANKIMDDYDISPLIEDEFYDYFTDHEWTKPRQDGGARGSREKRTDPKLWERVKKEITAGSKGGNPGQWSARKAQLAVQLYKARGGRYIGPKDKDNSLAVWTREKWDFVDGKKGNRYLPEAVRKRLTPAEKRSTNRRKRSATRSGKQYSSYNPSVLRKYRKYSESSALRRRRKSKKRKSPQKR